MFVIHIFWYIENALRIIRKYNQICNREEMVCGQSKGFGTRRTRVRDPAWEPKCITLNRILEWKRGCGKYGDVGIIFDFIQVCCWINPSIFYPCAIISKNLHLHLKTSIALSDRTPNHTWTRKFYATLGPNNNAVWGPRSLIGRINLKWIGFQVRTPKWTIHLWTNLENRIQFLHDVYRYAELCSSNSLVKRKCLSLIFSDALRIR